MRTVIEFNDDPMNNLALCLVILFIAAVVAWITSQVVGD